MERQGTSVQECIACGAASKISKRAPTGWKRRADELYCPGCWAKRYILRAISIPVSGPLDGDWKDLRASLRTMWDASTQASNWMITELYARDVRRGDEPKMPSLPRIYLYPEARKRFPQLPSTTLAAIEKTVSSRYCGSRYKVIWTCQQSLPAIIPIPGSLPSAKSNMARRVGRRTPNSLAPCGRRSHPPQAPGWSPFPPAARSFRSNCFRRSCPRGVVPL